jgi:phosphatidylinositol-3-phosphatase
MIARLRAIRLTWPQIALVAAASALATGVIIHASTSSQHVSYSMLAVLRHTVTVHRMPTPAPATAPASTTAPAAAAAPAPAAVAPVAPVADSAPPPAATATSSAGAVSSATPATTAPATPVPAAGHVFVIALATPSYHAAFGPGSVARYLNRTLRRRGVLLSGYRTLGGAELPDYLAMVSGQAPNADTRRDCPTYADFAGVAKALPSGQVTGPGCVYPNTVLTVADQVTAAGKEWKAYLADMGSSTCMHPDSNAADAGPLPGAGDDYATRHNPFVYFHSLLDLGGCASDDVALPGLGGDLRAAKRTPRYAFIAPGACDEPGAGSCPEGKAGGLVGEDEFLRRWVPAITSSRAYRQDGVLIIVFAKAPAVAGSRPLRTGALILSPKVKAGATVSTPYNPYSVLRSAEDLLGYTPLVHAKAAKSFADVAMPAAQ